MGIYDASGNELYAVYDADGTELDYAYDATGSIIYSKGDIPSNVIKVMTFNTGCFYTQYHPCPNDKTEEFYNRNRTIFNNSEPTLCGMPEWNNAIGTIQSSVLMNEFWDYYYPAYIYPVDTAGLTFASKYALENTELVRYIAQGTNTRYYEKAYVNIGGKRICFVNTHLDLSSSRNAQFIELLNMLEQEEYFIATGDFNFEINEIGDSEYNLSVKLALDRGFNSAQNDDGIFMTWYSAKTVALSTRINALDNIITSQNISISNVHVDITKLTDGLCEANDIIIDHLPLVCDCTIN